MPEALIQPCAAAESPAGRALRYAAGALLVLFALSETAMGYLLYAGQRGIPQLLYLLCSLALFAAGVVALRERRHALIAVRLAAIGAAVTLFWASTAGSTASVTFHGHAHDLTPLLACMLLFSVLLPRQLQQSESETVCNCS